MTPYSFSVPLRAPIPRAAVPCALYTDGTGNTSIIDSDATSQAQNPPDTVDMSSNDMSNNDLFSNTDDIHALIEAGLLSGLESATQDLADGFALTGPFIDTVDNRAIFGDAFPPDPEELPDPDAVFKNIFDSDMDPSPFQNIVTESDAYMPAMGNAGGRSVQPSGMGSAGGSGMGSAGASGIGSAGAFGMGSVGEFGMPSAGGSSGQGPARDQGGSGGSPDRVSVVSLLRACVQLTFVLGYSWLCGSFAYTLVGVSNPRSHTDLSSHGRAA